MFLPIVVLFQQTEQKARFFVQSVEYTEQKARFQANKDDWFEGTGRN